jgi:hypothetical protein
MGEALAHDEGGVGQRPIGVTNSHGDGGDVVGVSAGKEPRGAGRQRVGDRGARRQWRVLDVDQFERVPGQVGIVGHHQRHWLADVADHVPGDGWLQVPVGAGRGRHAVGDDSGGRDVGGREDRPDPGGLPRALGVDPDHPGVGVGRAQDRGVEHGGDADVLYVSAPPGHETASAQARMRLTDHCRIICLGRPADR